MNYELRVKSSKKEAVLIIDTSSNQEIKVGLRIDGKEDIMVQKTRLRKKAQEVLPMVDKILNKYSLTPQDLTEIEVNMGPGSFTGLRVGVAIANALAFSLKIPVNNSKIGDFVEPKYA